MSARLGRLLAGFLIGVPSSAFGQSWTETSTETIVIRDYVPQLALPSSQIVLDDQPPRFDTLGDILSEAPGTVVFRRGGVGSTQVVSIRGTGFDQTQVLVHDIPLTGPDRGAVDLSLIPLDGIERVEIYRGSAPIRFGSGTIGGVVRLVPKEVQRPSIWSEALGGSFGLLDLRGGADGYFGAWSGSVAGGFSRADNDFRYLDDNATNASSADDVVRNRVNAGLEQAHLFSRLNWSEGPHQLTLLGLWVHQARGLPGPATTISPRSRQLRDRIFTALGYRGSDTWFGKPVNTWISLGAGFDRDQVRDPEGLLGLRASDRDDTFWTTHGRLGLGFEPAPDWALGSFVIRLAGDVRYDSLEPRDGLDPDLTPSSYRLTLIGGLEGALTMDIDRMPLEVEASISGQYSDAQLRAGGLQGSRNQTVDARNVRTAAELEVLPGWYLLASFAEGLRLPTTLELFGNGSTIVGNVALDPERSTLLEGGTRIEFPGSWFSGTTELRLFRLAVEDLIVARRDALNRVRFTNERDAITLGVEGTVNLYAWDILESRTALTFLDSSFDNQGFERSQPLVVPWRLYERLSASFALRGWLSGFDIFAELDYRSGYFADSANLVTPPSYTSVQTGASLRLWEDRFTVFSHVRNLFDELGQDLLAFPRPGRSIELGLRVDYPL